MPLDIIEPLFIILGFVVFLASLAMFVMRTGDLKAVLMFWQAAIAFSHREFVVNRIGITIMIMGLILRFYNSWALA